MNLIIEAYWDEVAFQIHFEKSTIKANLGFGTMGTSDGRAWRWAELEAIVRAAALGPIV